MYVLFLSFLVNAEATIPEDEEIRSVISEQFFFKLGETLGQKSSQCSGIVTEPWDFAEDYKKLDIDLDNSLRSLKIAQDKIQQLTGEISPDKIITAKLETYLNKFHKIQEIETHLKTLCSFTGESCEEQQFAKIVTRYQEILDKYEGTFLEEMKNFDSFYTESGARLGDECILPEAFNKRKFNDVLEFESMDKKIFIKVQILPELDRHVRDHPYLLRRFYHKNWMNSQNEIPRKVAHKVLQLPTAPNYELGISKLNFYNILLLYFFSIF